MENKDEEEFRKLSVELRYFEQTAEAIQSRVNMVNAAIADLTYAMATLEGLEKEKEDSELLVPVGGSSFVRTKLADPNKVIVGVGAGVSIEKTLPDAKEITKRRLDDLNKTRVSLQQQFVQVADKINGDRQKIEAIIAKARQEKTS